MKKILTYVFILLFVGSLVACKNRNKKTETKTQKTETSIVKKSSATSKTTENNATSHVHTYDSEWNYNNDYHWHDA